MRKILLLFMCMCAIAVQAQEISLIPHPASMVAGDGCFEFKDKTVLCYPKVKNSGIDAVVNNFVAEIRKTTGVKIKSRTNVCGIGFGLFRPVSSSARS